MMNAKLKAALNNNNQSKLVYLEKSFQTKSSQLLENNYDELSLNNKNNNNSSATGCDRPNNKFPAATQGHSSCHCCSHKHAKSKLNIPATNNCQEQCPAAPESLLSSSKCKFKDQLNEAPSSNRNPTPIMRMKDEAKMDPASDIKMTIINKRLSCEELENLKERFVDFIKLDSQPSPLESQANKPQDMAANATSCKVVASSSSSSSSSSSCSSSPSPSSSSSSSSSHSLSSNLLINSSAAALSCANRNLNQHSKNYANASAEYSSSLLSTAAAASSSLTAMANSTNHINSNSSAHNNFQAMSFSAASAAAAAATSTNAPMSSKKLDQEPNKYDATVTSANIYSSGNYNCSCSNSLTTVSHSSCLNGCNKLIKLQANKPPSSANNYSNINQPTQKSPAMINSNEAYSPPLPPPPPQQQHHASHIQQAHINNNNNSNLVHSVSNNSTASSSASSIQIPNQPSRLSIASAAESSSSSSSAEPNVGGTMKPEPPLRTTSIRNSTCIYATSFMSPVPSVNDPSFHNLLMIGQNEQSPYYSRQEALGQPGNQQDDCLSIKSSSIYSSCRGSIGVPSAPHSSHYAHGNYHAHPPTGVVRSSRSVFSIYEEEDEICAVSSNSASSSASSSAGSSAISSSSSALNVSGSKLERLSEPDVKKIESMYRSIGSIVHVCSCTCDFFTTTTEQMLSNCINLSNQCWKQEAVAMVPMWLFDTGFNPKRVKQLRLMFVDRYTAFPVTAKPIVINKLNQLKNPNNDKRLTFTLKNKQVVCMIQFHDFFSCQEFLKFYVELSTNPRNSDFFCGYDEDIFAQQPQQKEIRTVSEVKARLRSKKEANANKKSQSRSMLSLNRIPDSPVSNNSSAKSNRFSQYLDSSNAYESTTDLAKPAAPAGKMRPSITIDNIKSNADSASKKKKDHAALPRPATTIITGITKNCISSPCAFQHINSLKDNDQHVKYLLVGSESTGTPSRAAPDNAAFGVKKTCGR